MPTAKRKKEEGQTSRCGITCGISRGMRASCTSVWNALELSRVTYKSTPYSSTSALPAYSWIAILIICKPGQNSARAHTLSWSHQRRSSTIHSSSRSMTWSSLISGVFYHVITLIWQARRVCERWRRGPLSYGNEYSENILSNEE